MENLNLGVEIECIYNSDIFDNIEIGCYHDGYIIYGLSCFTAEEDGSIHYNNEFDNPNAAEFVSKCFKNKEEFFKGLKDFKDFFSDNGKYELKDVLAFNSSCGSHIHFSLKDFKFTDKSIISCYEKTRNLFFDKIKNSNIKSKEAILKHYNRDYAKILKDNIIYHDRYMEFNFSVEKNGLGMEWRSINMINIKTWDEFTEFWKIVYSCLEALVKFAKKWNCLRVIDLNSFFPNIENVLKDFNENITLIKSRKLRTKIEIPVFKELENENLNFIDCEGLYDKECIVKCAI